MRFCTWMANSMPRPMRIGNPAIVTRDRLVPVNPNAPKPHSTPTAMPSSGSSRQRTPKATMRMTVMTATAIAPSVNIPPWR